MKTIWIAMVMVCLSLKGVSQTFDEWFEQKKTQIRYLKEQLAALEAYAQVAEQGYRIAQTGTQWIAEIKQGDFTMHQAYFNSLLLVQPAIRGDPRVQDIIAQAQALLQVTGQCRTLAGSLLAYSVAIGSVCDGLETGCRSDLDWLQELLTDGKIQSKDNERLREVGEVDHRMQDRYRQAVALRNEIGLLTINL
jgi:hypothetical protein